MVGSDVAFSWQKIPESTECDGVSDKRESPGDAAEWLVVPGFAC